EKMVPFAIQQTKIFANQVNAKLKSFHERALDSEGSLRAGLGAILAEVHAVRSQYICQVLKPRLTVDSSLRQALLNMDEFVSNRLSATFSDLHHRLAGQGSSQGQNLLIEALGKEAEYRKGLGGLYVDSAKSGADMEYFYYRHGLLKKFISRPL